MKKVFIISLLFLFAIGCSKANISNEQKKYDEYIEKLVEINEYSSIPFDFNIDIEVLSNNEYRYVASIDSPKEELYNIEALIMHNVPSTDVFPSSGIFDDKLNLIPNEIDLERNIVKGVLLIGYFQTEEKFIDFKLMLKSDGKEYYSLKSIDLK